jgi:hypothetical protein
MRGSQTLALPCSLRTWFRYAVLLLSMVRPRGGSHRRSWKIGGHTASKQTYSHSQGSRSRSVGCNQYSELRNNAASFICAKAFTGAAPFDDKPPHEARLAVMRGGRPLRPTHPTLTDGVWSLIKSCWDVDPNLRPRALWISCSL